MKFTITSHISTMKCLGIKKKKKNRTINLTKINKTATFNLKKISLKSCFYRLKNCYHKEEFQ